MVFIVLTAGPAVRKDEEEEKCTLVTLEIFLVTLKVFDATLMLRSSPFEPYKK